MLYLVACIMGLLAGIAAKGSITNIVCFRFEKVYFLIAAFSVQLVARLLSVMEFNAVKESSMLVYGIVFLLMVAAIWYNRSYLGILIIGAGYLINSLVMMLNDGKMPVSLETLERYGLTHMIDVLKTEIDGKHTLISEKTRLAWMTDIIHAPAILGKFNEVVSAGDLVIVLGFAVLIFEIVRGKRLKRRYLNV